MVTGGAGFIGSNLVRHLLRETHCKVVVLDALTYAGDLMNLQGCVDGDRCVFVKGDITDAEMVDSVFAQHGIDAVMHLAAESHVDRSIASAEPFFKTNVLGTLALLEASRTYGVKRFVHVSTDEVYGSLTTEEPAFTEESRLRPSSPYAASKASSDHLVMSFVHTHDMDCVVTRCTNNYGPYQYPEKFIPVMVLNALADRRLPIYGDGLQIRDWLHVEDHCRALVLALENGTSGEVYNLGGSDEQQNAAVAKEILSLTGKSEDLIEHVTDRPGHDRRYGINAVKAQRELGWSPRQTFGSGLAETIDWYQKNQEWCNHIYRKINGVA